MLGLDCFQYFYKSNLFHYSIRRGIRLSYTLKPVKPSELPKRGELKKKASQILNDFYKLNVKQVEVFNQDKPFKNKKEMMSLYDALKAVAKKNKLAVEVMTEKGRLFIVRET